MNSLKLRQFGGSLFEQASLILLDALIIDRTQDDPTLTRS